MVPGAPGAEGAGGAMRETAAAMEERASERRLMAAVCSFCSRSMAACDSACGSGFQSGSGVARIEKAREERGYRERKMEAEGVWSRRIYFFYILH